MVLVDQPRSNQGSVSLAPLARTLVDVFAATVAQFPRRLALEAPAIQRLVKCAGGSLSSSNWPERCVPAMAIKPRQSVRSWKTC